MNYQKLTKGYMVSVVVCGLICLTAAVVTFPLEKIDLQFLVLVGFTIGLGSRITVQIPRFKSHISVSDTFIFLTLLLYGGQLAVVLSAVEAFFSSWRFCNKKLTVFFNASAMAISTTAVVLALNLLGLNTENQLHGRPGYVQHFIAADRKSTRLNSSHIQKSRMPSSA